jgi:hypothetical protein
VKFVSRIRVFREWVLDLPAGWLVQFFYQKITRLNDIVGQTRTDIMLSILIQDA